MIDLLVVTLLVAYTAIGLRQGLSVGASSMVGFIGGAYLAIRIAPTLAENISSGPLQSLVILVCVLLAAWAGQVAGGVLGIRLRDRLELPLVRAVDQALGGLSSLLAVSLVLWFVAGAVREVAPPALARQVAGSSVLSGIDALVPPQFEDLASDFRQRVSTSDVPRVFTGVSPEPLVPIAAPDPAAVPDAVLTRVRRSVVKITGDVRGCNRTQEGSGAVIATGRVITNAHVVAGVSRPMVQVAGGGTRYQGRVVLFDPTTDVAVLAVPGLKAAPLQLGQDLGRGDDAVVAGYPRNGPYTAVGARVRTLLSATGEDIYGGAGAVRHVYSLFTTVYEGNSGGPLVAADGRLAGLVFAKSLDDAETGYALTLTEIEDEITAGAAASAQVDTGECIGG